MKYKRKKTSAPPHNKSKKVNKRKTNLPINIIVNELKDICLQLSASKDTNSMIARTRLLFIIRLFEETMKGNK